MNCTSFSLGVNAHVSKHFRSVLLAEISGEENDLPPRTTLIGLTLNELRNPVNRSGFSWVTFRDVKSDCKVVESL